MPKKEVAVKQADIGSATVISPVDTIRFNVHDFADLDNGAHISPFLASHGYHWCIEIMAYGEGDADPRELNNVSLFLHCQESTTDSPVKAKAVVQMGANDHDNDGDDASNSLSRQFTHKFEDEAHGWPNFCGRMETLQLCNFEGLLTIDVTLRVYHPAPKLWKPPMMLQNRMVQLYESAERSDVTFLVGEQRLEAHSCIIAMQCPLLADLANAANEVVTIDDTTPSLLDMLLRYVYAEQLPSSFNAKEHGLDLLELADRFGCVQLKLLLEAEIVESKTLFCFNEAIEMLLFADAHSCALLREAALDSIANNPEKLLQSDQWKTLRGSPALTEELLLVNCGIRENKGKWHNMRVAMLRKLLWEYGVEDVDGTKDMLIQRLSNAMATINDDKVTGAKSP